MANPYTTSAYALFPLKKEANETVELEVFERIIARNTTDLVCIHGADKCIVYCSESVKALLGYETDEMLGRELFDFMADEFRRNMNEALLGRMLYREGTEVKVMLRKSDGHNIWLKTSWQDGRHVAGLPDQLSISVSSDVTESVLLMEDLINAWSKEKEINELRASLFSIASHEFKTPLAVVQSQLDIMNAWCEQDQLDPKFSKLATKLQAQVDRLNHMITDVLQFRKMSTGREPFNPVPLQIRNLVDSEIEKILEKFPKAKIQVVEKGEEKSLQGDMRMLRYTISNLLNNALKYSPQQQRVTVTIKYKLKKVELYIKDKGVGIPLDDVHRIFKPFYRAANAVGIEGTGVALSIIKEFIAFHQGSIEVDSELQKGSTFIVSLPYELMSRI